MPSFSEIAIDAMADHECVYKGGTTPLLYFCAYAKGDTCFRIYILIPAQFVMKRIVCFIIIFHLCPSLNIIRSLYTPDKRGRDIE